MRTNVIAILVLNVLLLLCSAHGKVHHHKFVVKSSPYTRLCHTKHILTVNGQFPGPTLRARRGDKLVIKVINKAKDNITIHWHGVSQPRNPWSDGAEFINQCGIQHGNKFTYKVQLTREEGTIWWHAHSGWARATVHGAIFVYPKLGFKYPFPQPHAEVPIILGEWWKADVMSIARNANKTGGEPMLSDAYTINGQPGFLYPCSNKDTYTLHVERNRTYLLRIINAIMDEEMFFGIANHKLTLVGNDGSYTKPLKSSYIMITPGQSMDVLLRTDRAPSLYAMAARAYSSAFGAGFGNTTTTAIVNYNNDNSNDTKKSKSTKKSRSRSKPLMPNLPPYDRTEAATDFTRRLRSLASVDHEVNVPTRIDTRAVMTMSVNLLNCSEDDPCDGPSGRRFAASVNNVSFVYPRVDLLRAYYYKVGGVFGSEFPKMPPREFNYTGDGLPENLLHPRFGTEVLFLDYGDDVEIVFQGTNVVASDNHPVHLHGYSFYVVGWGFGNFDPKKDPKRYNLVDPPQVSTVGVPKNGWAAIRFKADNPGVWLMHCHIERHQSWGMALPFIVRNGRTRGSKILRPPKNLPPC